MGDASTIAGEDPSLDAEERSKGSEGSKGASSRAWIPVFVGALFVIGCAALFSWLLRPRPETTIVQPDGTVAVAKDAFARSSSDGLGRTPNGRTWETWSGGWAVSAGAAHVVAPDPMGSAVVLDGGADASISVTVGGNARCGVVAASSSMARSVRLVKDPSAQVFELRSVTGDVDVVLGTLPMPKKSSAVVTLQTERGVVTATVGGERVSVVVDDLPAGTFAGLLASGSDQTRCTFDDVVVFRPED